jgi:hypothetical protein
MYGIIHTHSDKYIKVQSLTHSHISLCVIFLPAVCSTSLNNKYLRWDISKKNYLIFFAPDFADFLAGMRYMSILICILYKLRLKNTKIKWQKNVISCYT